MALMPAIRNLGRFTSDFGEAFAAPGREREQRRRDQENANLAAQQSRATQQQLQTQRQEGQLNIEQRTSALPISTQEAQATAGVAEQARASDHTRATGMVGVQGQEVRDTLETTGQVRQGLIGAEAGADVQRFQGWNDTIGARQDGIIRGQQGHELALVDRFVGPVPQSQFLASELQKDRDLATEMQKRQMPLDWVKAATQGAATLGTLFI